MACARTGFLEIKVLEIFENQEMLCPSDCPEAFGPFECHRTFKPYMMITPVEEKLVYTVALVEASNVSTEETPISILPDRTHAVDSEGYSFDGCGFVCTTLTQILQALHDAEFSDIEIARGSKSRFLLVYPQLASGRRIEELHIDIYSFQGWSRNFRERCILSFEQGKSGEKNIEKKHVETATPNFIAEIMPRPENTSNNGHLGQNLKGSPPAKCLTCGKLILEPERRFCSTNCLIAYNKRGKREQASTLKPESSLEEERLKRGLIGFQNVSGDLKWGTVEETAEALLPRLREWAQEKKIRWTDVSAFLNTQEVAFHYLPTKIRLISTLYSELTKPSWRPLGSIERPGKISHEEGSDPNIGGRRCPECGGQRLIRLSERNELFCMDCCFVLRS